MTAVKFHNNSSVNISSAVMSGVRAWLFLCGLEILNLYTLLFWLRSANRPQYLPVFTFSLQSSTLTGWERPARIPRTTRRQGSEGSRGHARQTRTGWIQGRERDYRVYRLDFSLCCHLIHRYSNYTCWCPMWVLILVCVVQVSQVYQVRRGRRGCRGLQENLVRRVGLVSNMII